VNFEDEHYVRIYTRDTKTWLRWGWEGQAVFALTARKLDALGRVSVDEPVADIALLTGMPEEVVRVGLKRVLDSGAFVARTGYIECPRWIDGQTGSKSDSARAREYRARLKAKASRDVIGASQSVTTASRDDTPASNPSQPNAAQCSAVHPDRARGLSPGVSRTYSLPCAEPPKDYLDQAVIESTPTERAKATWKHYWGAGLPANGVERLYSWLLQQAREKAFRDSRVRVPRTEQPKRTPRHPEEREA